MRCLAPALLASLAAAQNPLFEEPFDQGVPTTWSQLQLGLSGDRWLAGANPLTASRDVWHEYFCVHGTLFRDNWLVTPPIDLRGLTTATLQFDDHQILPAWRLLNSVEVRVGAATWQRLFTVTRSTGGIATVAIDLAAWIGQPGVQFAFHYQGDIANEWRIDNVRVTTAQPVLRLHGLGAGATGQAEVRGASPGLPVLVGLSAAGAGPLPTPFGNLLLTPPLALLPLALAGPAGSATVPVSLPAAAAGLGLSAHAAALRSDGTLHWTNAVAAVVP